MPSMKLPPLKSLFWVYVVLAIACIAALFAMTHTEHVCLRLVVAAGYVVNMALLGRSLGRYHESLS